MSGSGVENSKGLRRSCTFCRARKIKCTGERICEQCHIRNIICNYATETSRGRPKPAAVSASQPKTKRRSGLEKQRRSSKCTGDPQTFGGDAESAAIHEATQSYSRNSGVSQRLESLFHKFFQEESLERLSDEISSRARSPAPTPDPNEFLGDRTIQVPKGHSEITYTELFQSLAPSLIQLVSTRFGSLGCCNEDDNTVNFLLQGVLTDMNTAVDDGPVENSRGIRFGDYKVQQLVEIFFNHHPLSFILSKTLLLNDYVGGRHDATLLSVILAEAVLMLEGSSESCSKELFQQAHAQVHLQNAGPPAMSLVQSLVFLGWHDLFARRARRGFCYIMLAWDFLLEMESGHGRSGPVEGSLNGVDVDSIRHEIFQRLYWLTFALALWCSIQLDVAFSEVFPVEVKVSLPSIENSHVFGLDIESGNVSTLSSQKEFAASLWELSHIVSTSAYVYALYPQSMAKNTSGTRTTNQSWQSGTLARLRGLLKGETNLASVCGNVRKILSDGLEQLSQGGLVQPSRTFVLAAYHTMVIHFLFPIESTIASDGLSVDDVLEPVIEFERLLSSIGASRSTDGVTTRNAQILALGLDASSRGLNKLRELSESSTASPFKEQVLSRGSRIAWLARKLHTVCKTPSLRAVPSSASTKRLLREAYQCFEKATDKTNPPRWLPQDEAVYHGSLPPLTRDNDTTGAHGLSSTYSADLMPSQGMTQPLVNDFSQDWASDLGKVNLNLVAGANVDWSEAHKTVDSWNMQW